MHLLTQQDHVWQYALAALTLALSLFASGHAVLHKRDSRAAVLWVAFVWFIPLVGAVLYFIWGVNRIKRRAILLRGNLERYSAQHVVEFCSVVRLATLLPAESSHLTSLAGVTSKVLSRPDRKSTRLNSSHAN